MKATKAPRQETCKLDFSDVMYATPVNSRLFPPWVKGELTYGDLYEIRAHGCASGAYMPAVTYHAAMRTMGDWGDEVLEYIANAYCEVPGTQASSWSGICSEYLSMAVELWAAATLEEYWENDIHTMLEELYDAGEGDLDELNAYLDEIGCTIMAVETI